MQVSCKRPAIRGWTMNLLRGREKVELKLRGFGNGAIESTLEADEFEDDGIEIPGRDITTKKLKYIKFMKVTQEENDISYTPHHQIVVSNGAKQSILQALTVCSIGDEVKCLCMFTSPLHMAVKNGCNEAVWLLLSHGASTKAKANACNGMNPLNLSVWHSLMAEDTSTVKTLLDHNSQCSAKDDLEEQRKHKAIESCTGTQDKMDELEKKLSNLVGFNELKLQFREWAKWMLIDER
ncbi:protein cfxQ [Tanacetum coccineum]|uniref:Protein cfxQ n=1 Tax=Tanacetum coccineum TaxID=301880 RepID=A0ABQ5DA09_9ASTR